MLEETRSGSGSAVSLPTAHILSDQTIEHGGERNAQQHARHTHQLSADADGKQDPHPRQTDRMTDGARIDEVAFHLLQDDQEDQKDQRFLRGDEDEQDHTDRTADIGAQDRDQGRQRNDRADEGRIVQPQDQHADKAQLPRMSASRSCPLT